MRPCNREWEIPRKALADRLEHALITAQNDDLSKPMSEKRERHSTRQETIRDVLEYLRSPLPGTREEVARASAGMQDREAMVRAIVAGKFPHSTNLNRTFERYHSDDHSNLDGRYRTAISEAYRDVDAILALSPAPMPEREGMREALTNLLLDIDETISLGCPMILNKWTIEAARAALAPHDKTEGSVQLLSIVVPSDIDNAPIEPDGPIGLYHIRFNHSEWSTIFESRSLAILDGQELVLRRNGREIGVFRRK